FSFCFSSRRRHTRSKRDWSSDVCSSDLVSRSGPVFVDDAKFLRQQTGQPIKWALPGPMTMIDTLYDGHYGSREKLAWEFATILNQEARDLEAAGVDIIQFDEPAFNVYFDELKD